MPVPQLLARVFLRRHRSGTEKKESKKKKFSGNKKKNHFEMSVWNQSREASGNAANLSKKAASSLLSSTLCLVPALT